MNTNRRNDRISPLRHREALSALAVGVILIFGFACGTTGPTPPAPAPAPAPAPDTEPAPPPPPVEDDDDMGGMSDAAIHDRVHAALEAAPDLEGSDISVRVENGVVYLGGHVHTSDQRQVAHNVAHAVDGVSRVYTDDIEIR